MIETIKFKDDIYPIFQTQGFAAQYAFPFARHICTGRGFDIGYGKTEWKLPGAVGIDLANHDEWHAMNLPEGEIDYIFSSHCLEHLDNWVEALEYWISRLKIGGNLFLYLPHRTQQYWKPFNNRKHIHTLDGDLIKECLEKLDMGNIFLSSYDLNNSFYIIGEKFELNNI